VAPNIAVSNYISISEAPCPRFHTPPFCHHKLAASQINHALFLFSESKRDGNPKTVADLTQIPFSGSNLRLKYNGTHAENRFRLSAKRTSPFKSAGGSVQSATGSRGVRISGSNAGYTMFLGSVKSTGHPLHSPVSPSLLLPCVTVCHHISTGLYNNCYVTTQLDTDPITKTLCRDPTNCQITTNRTTPDAFQIQIPTTSLGFKGHVVNNTACTYYALFTK
jgi:hypothetical protein